MRGLLRLLILSPIALALCGASCGTTRPPRVEIVEIPVRKFVPIDDALTAPCPIAEGPLSAVLDVAKARREALVVCNDQLQKIRALQPESED